MNGAMTAPTGFEGSYLGASDKFSARAIMECKICWTPYDPAEGDDKAKAGIDVNDAPTEREAQNQEGPTA